MVAVNDQYFDSWNAGSVRASNSGSLHTRFDMVARAPGAIGACIS
jgi:hypothetical protein